MKRTLFVTGAAGYVGAMLCDQLAERDDVERIVALDKEPMPDFLKGKPKIAWIGANTSDGTWQERVRAARPDVVIHTAWQIREMYGDRRTQWKWNVEGSDAVFEYAFDPAHGVDRLIYFSTVASYGAYPDNTIEHRFVEEEGFRKSDYLYAEEKRIVEERLARKYAQANERGARVKVAIIRPAAITGPRGRYMRVRFGLQSALSGQLKGSVVYRIVSLMVSFVPVTRAWCRQFVHEDDIADIVALLVFGSLKTAYETFNACPPGDVVRAADMARAVGKRTVPVPPLLVRFAFFCMWHGTRGKIPTSRGGWKSYSYPIAVDGSKITRMYGYAYRMPSKEAFVKKEGRYARYAS